MLLKPDELIHFAMQIEERGFRFFQGMAAQAAEPELKKVLESLADEEEKHYHAFDRMLAEMKSYGPPEYYMDEYEAYVWNLAKSHVLTGKADPGQYLEKVKSPLEAVDLALAVEKDTILFFVALKKIVFAEGQKTLDLLIDQENLHIKKLLELKKKLQGKESW
ncbi:MAG: ferritin family protein [Peptococcaceae bacterium]|nr:ferritin family protein [Peptococcaceae bacterium]